MELMDKWDADRKTLLDMLAKTDQRRRGRRDLIGKTLDFLEMNDLDRFYEAHDQKAGRKLPNGEGRRHEEMAKT